MKKFTSSTIAKATLALALATGGTALYAQDSDVPESDLPGEPAPAEPLPADPAPPPPPSDPVDGASEPVDEDGDGIDDVTGEPIEDQGSSDFE